MSETIYIAILKNKFNRRNSATPVISDNDHEIMAYLLQVG